MSDSPLTDAVETNCRPRDGMGLAATLLLDFKDHACRLERDRARLMEILDGITARHEGYGGGFGPCLCEWHEKSRALLKELTC